LGTFLIPPVPSRADIIHHCADLLMLQLQDNHKHQASFHSHSHSHSHAALASNAMAKSNASANDSKMVSCLDIGCGASSILSLIAAAEYGWRVVGTDVSKDALQIAKQNVMCSHHASLIELRHQTKSNSIFEGIVKPDEYFDITVCNPPFYSSKEEAQAASQRKISNLGLSDKRNFAGTSAELWCVGGELAFVRNMIAESYAFRSQLGWITSLVSDQDNAVKLLDELTGKTASPRSLSSNTNANTKGKYKAGLGVHAAELPSRVECTDLTTGKKKSRIIAWKWG